MMQQKQLLVHFSEDNSFLQTVPNPKVIMLNRSIAWDSIGVRHFHFLPTEAPDHRSLEHAVIVHLRDEIAFERRIGDRIQQGNLQQGNIFIVPAQMNHSVLHTHESEELIITLDPARFAQNAREFADRDRLELQPTFAQNDPLIFGISQTLKSVLESPKPGDSLYIDSLITTLSIHLLRYCTRSQNPPSYNDGLPRYKLDRVLDYIDAHFNEDIQLIDLAATIGISQYYFLRSFKQSMGVTPHRYLLQKRIERAKELLKQQEMAIADIALECGFANQTHFTKSFRQHAGITPKAYRQK